MITLDNRRNAGMGSRFSGAQIYKIPAMVAGISL